MAQNYFNSDIVIPAESKLRLDGSASGNTHISESAADTLTFTTGGTTALTLNSSQNATIGGTVTATVNADADSTYTGIVVSESGLLKYRTKAQILSDIGAGTGSGNVSSSGTPADNYVAVWTNSSTIEGTSDFQWNGSLLTVNGEGRFYDSLILDDDSGTSPPLQFITGAGDIWQIYNHSSNGLSFQNSSTVYFTMTSTATSIDTSLSIGTIDEIGSDTNKFLMSDSGVVKFVTGANLRSYIGAGTGSGTMSSFTLAGDSGSSQTIENGDTLTVAGGTYIGSVASATDTITLNHDSTTRNDTTSSASPGSAGTFTAVDSVTSNATGHVTAINVKTVTMPTSPTVNNNTITLAAGTGLSGGGSFTLNQGSDETITFTADNNGTVTGTGSAGRVAYWDSASSITSDGDLTFDGSDLTVGGKIITTEIESSGVIVLDAAGDITLDADGADIVFKNGGTEFGRFTDSSSDFVIKSAVNNKDIIFKGVDNNSTITSLTLDMSNAGAATFAGNVSVQGDQLSLSTDTLIEYGLSSGIDYNIGAPVSGTNARGERISMYTTTGMTAGDLYVTSDFAADWTPANNTDDDTKNMIVVAIGASSSTDQVLLRGIFRKASHGFTTGQPLYVGSTDGQFTATVPTSGYVRVVGYAVNSNEIYFCPDNTWVEIN